VSSPKKISQRPLRVPVYATAVAWLPPPLALATTYPESDYPKKYGDGNVLPIR
jgi:hypothetical protein